MKHTDHVKMPLGASDEESRKDNKYIDSWDDSCTTDCTSSVTPGVVTHKWTISLHGSQALRTNKKRKWILSWVIQGRARRNKSGIMDIESWQ